MIHPTAIIGDDVMIGTNVTIGAYAVIKGSCSVGDDVTIGAHTCIGGEPQIAPHNMRCRPVGDDIWIGTGAIIREHCVIHYGVYAPTIIGSNSYVMCGVHIGHDTFIGSRTTIGSHTAFGGFNIVGSGVTFGQGVITHPWLVIGNGAMVGLNTSVLNDVYPYQKVAGAPARLLGKNRTAPWDDDDWDASRVPAVDVSDFAVAQLTRDRLKSAWANASSP